MTLRNGFRLRGCFGVALRGGFGFGDGFGVTLRNGFRLRGCVGVALRRGLRFGDRGCVTLRGRLGFRGRGGMALRGGVRLGGRGVVALRGGLGLGDRGGMALRCGFGIRVALREGFGQRGRFRVTLHGGVGLRGGLGVAVRGGLRLGGGFGVALQRGLGLGGGLRMALRGSLRFGLGCGMTLGGRFGFGRGCAREGVGAACRLLGGAVIMEELIDAGNERIDLIVQVHACFLYVRPAILPAAPMPVRARRVTKCRHRVWARAPGQAPRMNFGGKRGRRTRHGAWRGNNARASEAQRSAACRPRHVTSGSPPSGTSRARRAARRGTAGRGSRVRAPPSRT